MSNFNNSQQSQKKSTTFDWDNLSDIDLTDTETEDEFDFEESSVDFEESSADMEEELAAVFYKGAGFKSMQALRSKAQDIGRKFNCPITTARSTTNSFIILQCKHSGEYRKAKKVDVEEECTSNKSTISVYEKNKTNASSITILAKKNGNTEAGEDTEETKTSKQKSTKTGKRGCPLRIYASVCRDAENPWMVRDVVLKHNHALSENGSTYAQFRKLDPAVFEFVRTMLRKGETASSVLKVGFNFWG